MKNKQFYDRLAKEIYENSHPDYKHIVENLKITSLHQVLGIVRSLMSRNNKMIDESKHNEKQLKYFANILDIEIKEE